MKENLTEKFEKALDKFVLKQKKNPNVIGIIASGSFIHSKLDKNSDLDVYVVLEKSKYRERGNTWINGVEIEYFINPINQVKSYFKHEKKPATAHMFANSKILYRKGSKLDELITQAKKFVQKKTPKMSKLELELAKYFLDDLKKDLEDVKINNDKFTFELIGNEIIERSLNNFFQVKRCSKEKHKRLKQQLKELDSKFEKVYSKALLKRSYKNLLELVEHTEKLLGGKRPIEWKLKSKCTC
ncbi:MAG: nucleotidyltransferase domain-containing protein [archaeon]